MEFAPIFWWTTLWLLVWGIVGSIGTRRIYLAKDLDTSNAVLMGVFAAGIPELGLGIALKAQDGTKRAAEVALSHILHQLGAKPNDPDFSIEQPLYNRNQWHIGSVRPVD